MLARTHVTSGALTYLVLAPAGGVHGLDLAIGTAVAGAAALLSDLDHPGGTASRMLGPLHGLASLVAKLTGGHRGGTHSVVAMLAAGAIGEASGAPEWFAMALLVGVAAHVAGDCLTPQGCALAWPLSRRHFAVPLVPRTGGRVERLLVAPAIGLAVALIAARYVDVDPTSWLNAHGMDL